MQYGGSHGPVTNALNALRGRPMNNVLAPSVGMPAEAYSSDLRNVRPIGHDAFCDALPIHFRNFQ